MRHFLLALSLLLGGVYAQAAPVASLSLDDCYQSALKRSEIIADQTELIVQAEAHYRQAIGSVLPTISGSASYLVQEIPGGPNSNIFPASQPLVKLTINQPLFRGFRDFAALRYTEKLTDAQKQAKELAQLQLFYDVSQNFYTVLSLERDIDNLIREIELYQKRVGELNGRVKIGRSRLPEVLTVQTSASALRAQGEQIRGQLAATREMFAFLTGLPAETELVPELPTSKDLMGLNEYTSQAEKRPDVKVAKLRLDAAKENTSVIKGGHFPSLDLAGNYYLKRFGVLSDVKWDLQLTLSVPIFNGGIIESQVHEAKSKELQGELAVTRSKRMADEEIKTYYRSVQFDISQTKELEKTTELAEKNFEQQTREYRLGLVNNLEVLQALTTFQESQRTLDRARYQGAIDFEKLEAAAGKNPRLVSK